MKNDIPLVTNDEGNFHCMQACIAMVLVFYNYPILSFEKLDRLSYRKEGLWTWTIGGALALYELGFNVTYYSKSNLLEMDLTQPSFKAIYKSNYKEVKEYLDFDSLVLILDKVKIIPDFFRAVCFSIKDFEDVIVSGHIAIVGVNSYILEQCDGFYGHYIILTGFDELNFYYNDPGYEGAGKSIPIRKEIFMNAYNSDGTENNLIVVRNKF